MKNIESQIRSLRNGREPYVGMPLPGFSGSQPPQQQESQDPLAGLPLAMAYVPWQQWGKTYEPAEGWKRGTIFPDLDLPFEGGGTC